MKTEYLRRDPFPQPLLPADTGSLPSPPLSCPGAPPSSLPPFPSWPLQVLRCLHVSRHQVPNAACSCRVLAHCQAAHCRGEFFKPPLIRETIGGREKGKRKVVDSVKVCQNSGCTWKTSRKWKEREREGGKARQAWGPSRLPCHSALPLLPSRSGCVGTAEEQKAGDRLGFVSFCLMSGKLIAPGLGFLFCTISVVIPTSQGGCED